MLRQSLVRERATYFGLAFPFKSRHYWLMADVFRDRLIAQVIGDTDSRAQRRMGNSGIEWYTLLTQLGPARFGFDYEQLELVRLRNAGTVIDLARRPSYGIHILTGSCMVVWRPRSSDLSLWKAGSKGPPESSAEFEMRIGKIHLRSTDRTTKLELLNPAKDLSLATIPNKKRKGKRELIFGSAFDITLISESDDVLLAVFSSEGPGNPSSSSPQPHSTS